MFRKLSILFSTIFLSLIFSQDPCTCENDFEPVCGIDGFTYPNECITLCFGTQVDYEGECGSQNNCGPGEYTDVDGNCYLCAPGTFSEDGISCNSCMSGTMSNGQMECPDGLPECGATECVDCEAGSYAMGEGNASCEWCEPGTFSSMGAGECNWCPNDLYSNGQMDCWDETSECGGTDCVDCNGESWGDAIVDEYGECSESQSGCTYMEAYNFDVDAYTDDGSCEFPCQGDFDGDSGKNILDIIILVDEILNNILCE